MPQKMRLRIKSKRAKKNRKEGVELTPTLLPSKKTTRKTGEKQITYVLTRILFIRSIAFIYFVAFLVAYNQNPGLLGDDGLLSSQEYFNRLKQHVGVNTPPQKSVMQIPTLLWFLDDQQVFNNIQQFALAGLTISAFVFYHGGCNACCMFILWSLYHSIVSVGQRWYSFGWETQCQ